ncbi:MAG: hypothetical protein VYC34_06660 [Planctomycetota bacterium]|nr:hypothetical protein [Planctomycetota bacterium]
MRLLNEKNRFYVTRALAVTLFSSALALGAVACEEDTDVEDAAEEAAENVEDAADDTADAVDDAVDDAGDAVDDAIDDNPG